ncbi:MAG TPA: hypothetical protein VFO90_03415 [Terrimicrobiaceae bacterium]|nr:hypothetical protein [Terrimicrobiaceae bacterium]
MSDRSHPNAYSRGRRSWHSSGGDFAALIPIFYGHINPYIYGHINPYDLFELEFV